MRLSVICVRLQHFLDQRSRCRHVTRGGMRPSEAKTDSGYGPSIRQLLEGGYRIFRTTGDEVVINERQRARRINRRVGYLLEVAFRFGRPARREHERRHEPVRLVVLGIDLQSAEKRLLRRLSTVDRPVEVTQRQSRADFLWREVDRTLERRLGQLASSLRQLEEPQAGIRGASTSGRDGSLRQSI